jgi:hypothetical protein
MPTTKTFTHPTDVPMILRLEQPHGRATIKAVKGAKHVRVTVETTANDGPAADAVNATHFGPDGEGRLRVSVPPVNGVIRSNGGGGIMIGGDVYGGIHQYASVSGGAQVYQSVGDLNVQNVGGVHQVSVSGGAPEIRVTVELPVASSVVAVLASTDLVVEGPIDAAQVQSASGDVEIQVCDEVTVGSSSGDVELEGIGAASVRTSSGDVKVFTAGRVTAHTASGDVELDTIREHVEIGTSSGSARVRNSPTAEGTIRTVSGSIRCPDRMDTATMTGRVRKD